MTSVNVPLAQLYNRGKAHNALKTTLYTDKYFHIIMTQTDAFIEHKSCQLPLFKSWLYLS